MRPVSILVSLQMDADGEVLRIPQLGKQNRPQDVRRRSSEPRLPKANQGFTLRRIKFVELDTKQQNTEAPLGPAIC